jgi:hypothetical protein
VIAIGIWIGAVFALSVVVGIAGDDDVRTFDTIAASDEFALANLGLLLASCAGWILFAYAKGGIGRRWLYLGGLVGGAFLIGVGLVLPVVD